MRFRVRVSGSPEVRHPREPPAALARRLARHKALRVARLQPRAAVLGADTVVCLGSRVLGTPHHRAEALRMLRLLSGREHRVWTAVALILPGAGLRQQAVCTRVRVARMSEAERTAYLNSGEWQGKAGAYGIQGRFAAYVRSLTGSYTNVVGLPLEPLRRMLRRAGLLEAPPEPGRRSRKGAAPPRRAQAPPGRQRSRGRRAAATSSSRRTGVR